jgi:hypothetical protein
VGSSQAPREIRTLADLAARLRAGGVTQGRALFAAEIRAEVYLGDELGQLEPKASTSEKHLAREAFKWAGVGWDDENLREWLRTIY